MSNSSTNSSTTSSSSSSSSSSSPLSTAHTNPWHATTIGFPAPPLMHHQYTFRPLLVWGYPCMAPPPAWGYPCMAPPPAWGYPCMAPPAAWHHHTTIQTSSASLWDSSAASKIDPILVKNLIERCLPLYLTKEECMEALSRHANITPAITSAVWDALEKANKEFFQAYAQSKSKGVRMSLEEMRQLAQKISSKDSDDED